MEPKRPLKLSEMARAVGVKTAWLRDEADDGRIPHLRAGDSYLFDRDTVMRVLSERARAGRDAEGAAGVVDA